ncbi:aldo/keto reductase [Paraburkholderia fungorum]|uniref:aldo/keto reductase n=1 Tax=Paraburkholderia fungorum TaxID=134537 RepID=UPI00047F3A73|nr:aldo/keto reductase [Paraburkholderia fungorum]KFX66585.1 oxidoreductase [Burkholderia sp. K24]MBB5541801.1 diketogulonate reductase-like aldo/keto reductase [Paraburkholderia fungorum]PNE53944.1 aldo/keto reductase [Paraburkholderia fungorum]USX05712.1 aldo/keto reductase [Paraburkholderia fungorum]
MATFKGPAIKLNNGIEMPGFGLGVFRSEPEKTVAAVQSALAHGYRLIDTAAAYMNEQQVGEGIRASGVPREDVFVTTKVWMTDYGYDQTLRAFDRSLRKLELDYLDLYLTHWPVPSAFDETVASYKASMKLLADGRVRAIGVCNFSSSHMRNLIEQTGHIPAVNQIEVHPFFIQSDLRDADEALGIITQAWSPIGGIKRDGEKAKTSGNVLDPLSHPSVVQLATKYGKSPAQIVLRWQIQLGTCPIPKSVRPERIAENIDIFNFALAANEVQAISALDTGERGGPDPELVSPQTFPVTTHP